MRIRQLREFDRKTRGRINSYFAKGQLSKYIFQDYIAVDLDELENIKMKKSGRPVGQKDSYKRKRSKKNYD